jgi:hypothetical protein
MEQRDRLPNSGIGFWQSETHCLGGSSPPNLSHPKVTIIEILPRSDPLLAVN